MKAAGRRSTIAQFGGRSASIFSSSSLRQRKSPNPPTIYKGATVDAVVEIKKGLLQ
jgi:hypothetical protein